MAIPGTGSAAVPEKTTPQKSSPHYFLLAGGLILFLIHLALWPLVWHLILLPQARPDKHQLRVESSAPHRVDGTSLFLDKPDTSLSAYAVWQVPKAGFYHFKLSCDDNGKVLIDNRPVVSLQGTSPLNVGEAKRWLSPGRHFLALGLNNNLGHGWLKIEVVGPGQTGYGPLNINELSYLDLGNLTTWEEVVFWGKLLCLLGILGLVLSWIILFLGPWKVRYKPLSLPGYLVKNPAEVLFLLLSLICSFFWMQLRFAINPDCNIATLIDLTYGQACIPFQYRILVPSTVYLISEKLGFNYIKLSDFYKFFEFISIFSLVLAYRRYLSFLFNTKTAIYFFTFSLFIPLNGTFFQRAHCFFPSDIPSILFFTLGLIFLFKENWKAYYLIFVLGTLNRETTCFLTLICIFTLFGKAKWRHLIYHSLLQFLIWISIKIFLYYLFSANIGDGFIETKHIADNLEFLAHLKNYPLLFGGVVLFIWLPTLVCSSLIKNEFVKKSIWVSIPFFIGMIWVGAINEIRIFADLIPVLFPAFLLILKEIFLKELAKST